MRKEKNIVEDKSIITSLTAKIHFSYFLNSSSFCGPLPPFLQPCWMIINTALLYWIRSWQLLTLQNNRQLPGSVLPCSIRSVHECVCYQTAPRQIERKAKEKAERAWILIYGTLFWTHYLWLSSPQRAQLNLICNAFPIECEDSSYRNKKLNVFFLFLMRRTKILSNVQI